MNLNMGSFTDEQLLNLINNSIIEKTDYSIHEFTGGYVSMTSTRGHTKEACKVALLFGYKNRNSQSFTFDIKKDLAFIWMKAIMLKISSIKLDETGMDFNELNSLMNEKKEDKKRKNEGEHELSYDDRTNVHCTHTPTHIPNTSIPITYDTLSYDSRTNIKTFLDMKNYVLKNKRNANGSHIQFEFENRQISISDKDIPYYRDSSKNLDFNEADRFYKFLFTNLTETIMHIAKQQKEEEAS